VKELFDRGYGRAVQPLSGPPGGAISIDNGGSQSLATIARKVALAFRIASMEAEAGLLKDAGDGLRSDLLKRLAAKPPRGVE
jgi:hypothetical protein